MTVHLFNLFTVHPFLFSLIRNSESNSTILLLSVVNLPKTGHLELFIYEYRISQTQCIS